MPSALGRLKRTGEAGQSSVHDDTVPSLVLFAFLFSSDEGGRLRLTLRALLPRPGLLVEAFRHVPSQSR